MRHPFTRLLVFLAIGSALAVAAGPPSQPTTSQPWPAPRSYRQAGFGMASSGPPATRPVATRPAPQPRVVELTVRPAPESRPALKYLLLPDFLDREPGNAALLYYQAYSVLPQGESARKNSLLVADWLALAPKDFPRKEIAKVLNTYGEMLRFTEAAARRETCDWEIAIRKEGFAALLPHLGPARHVARVLALKARLEVAEGKYNEAIHTLQTGFAMSRHLAQGSLLVSALTGTLIAREMAEAVQELVAAPDAPNLYWAIAHLPRPLTPSREALEIERDIAFIKWPHLRKAASDERALTAGDWAKVVADMQSIGMISRQSESSLMAMALALRLYPEAKRALIAAGRPPEQVEAMPVAQVIAIHQVGQFVELCDDLFKWFGLPYWQAQEGLRKWEQEVAKIRSNPLVVLLPGLSRACLSEAELDRRLAALQCIEGIRIYAAAHEGRPPERLDLMTTAPAPIDPVTGKPFEYAVDGQRFVLICPAPPGERADRGETYVVTLEQ